MRILNLRDMKWIKKGGKKEFNLSNITKKKLEKIIYIQIIF